MISENENLGEVTPKIGSAGHMKVGLPGLVRVSCYRLYVNDFGYEDYISMPDYDRDFSSADIAIRYMDRISAMAGIDERIVWDVEVL